MRVISGSARGRKLKAPDGDLTRPITDRAKEGIFNMLINYAGLDGARVLDLFAGSGSFGIEALSRGAEHVTFVEKRRQARVTIEENLATLGFSDRARVVAGTVPECLVGMRAVDVAFCDPPYALDIWAEIFGLLPADTMVGHAESAIAVTGQWDEVRRRTYGRSQIVIAQRLHSTESDDIKVK